MAAADMRRGGPGLLSFFLMRSAAKLILLCLLLCLGLGPVGAGGGAVEHGSAVLALADGGDGPPTSLDGPDMPDGAVPRFPPPAVRGASRPWGGKSACGFRSCIPATPLPPPRPAQV